ncbi:hypothetical protein KIN20_002792 [Parelaphostrongylus tenuis]|uniref:Uncharacterized protein n=1 Tax=Parelaphostrongylus tenuis TaxID=148309 RepID=A0AAD5QD77_PARTN|nr:hypothetical protein KIN20_002792 [Parelaphostrongylus tenuis]
MHIVTFVVIIAAAAALQSKEFFHSKRGGGRLFVPLSEKRGPAALFSDENGGIQSYGRGRWHENEERMFKNLGQKESLTRSEFIKRGGGRNFGGHKRAGARFFTPTEQQHDTGLFATQKKRVHGFLPFLRQNEVVTEEKKGGGRTFSLEKKGGARMFRGGKRDHMDEYPEWSMYEDTPQPESEQGNGEEPIAIQ